MSRLARRGAVASYIAPSGGGSIAASHLTQGIASGPTTVTTASVSPTSGAVLFLAIGMSHQSSDGLPSNDVAVSGLGGTWTQVSASTTYGFRRRCFLFVGVGCTGTGTIDIDYDIASVKPDIQEVGWVLDELTGVDTTTPTSGAEAWNPSGGGGATYNTISDSVGDTPAAGDATYSALFLEQDSQNGSPDSGWAGLGTTSSTGNAGVRRVETAWSSTADTDVTWSWSSNCFTAMIVCTVKLAP